MFHGALILLATDIGAGMVWEAVAYEIAGGALICWE
jgi:hypothetical protein